jgi:hypothetical protein
VSSARNLPGKQLPSPAMTTASALPPRKYVKSREMKRRKVQGKEIKEEEGKSSFYFFTAGEEKRSREENDQEQTTYKDRRSCEGRYADTPHFGLATRS